MNDHFYNHGRVYQHQFYSVDPSTHVAGAALNDNPRGQRLTIDNIGVNIQIWSGSRANGS